jgi:two-component system, NarL family, invasion response regulator UvrY
MNNSIVKIGIVDDHSIVRSGLRQFLSEMVDLRVVGEAASGREAIDLVRGVEMDVIIMDLSMPGQSGIDALAMIRAKAPDVGILILSGYPEEQYAVNLIRQGASGYLNKECEPMEIVNAIRTIALGRRYISPSVAELIAQQLNRKEGSAAHDLLSEREFQVFLKLAKGETAGDIASALSLSVKTVSTYRTRMIEKLGVRTTADLVRYAVEHKLFE